MDKERQRWGDKGRREMVPYQYSDIKNTTVEYLVLSCTNTTQFCANLTLTLCEFLYFGNSKIAKSAAHDY